MSSKLVKKINKSIKTIKPTTHKGLPLLSFEEFRSQYTSQSTDNTIKTFDFQGYVEMENGNIEYRDVTAMNGLRDGIHIGIDGTIDYHKGQTGLKKPEQIEEYVVYITIPASVQKKEGVICKYGNCYSIEDYIKKWGEKEAKEDIKKAHSEDKLNSDGYVVMRLDIDPKKTPNARKKISSLSHAFNEYLRQDYPLGKLYDFMRVIDSLLAGNINPFEANSKIKEKLLDYSTD